MPASLQNVVGSNEQQNSATTTQGNNLAFEFNKNSPGSVGVTGPSDVNLPGCAGDNGIKRKISAEDIKPGTCSLLSIFYILIEMNRFSERMSVDN